MSSPKVRHLLNNLCSLPNTSYLEIGCWKGSTLISALYGNQNSVVQAIAIDNWSQFAGPYYEFQQNCAAYLQNINYHFYSADSFKVNLETTFPQKVNVYFYDGDHTSETQKQAFTYFDPILDDVFIAVVDDWNYPDTQAGTRLGFLECNYEVLYEIALPAKHNCDLENWWDGLYVAVIRKR